MTGAETDVLIIGAGFSGLRAMHAANRAGLSAAGVEAGGGVGGTWYWNRYPGARCDVESIDYSYSFDPLLQDEWEWSERYATQPEILAYLEHVADRYDLRRRFEFGTTVLAASFDGMRWSVRTDGNWHYRPRFLLCATGSLSIPSIPDLPGLDEFTGRTLLTARWPAQEVSFRGQRVGVLGTGSSGIQSIPLIAEQAAELTVFQRTANYSVPADNCPFGPAERAEIRRAYSRRRAASAYSAAGTPHESYPADALAVDQQERDNAFQERWSAGGVLFGKTFPRQTTDERVNALARDFAEAKIRATVRDPQVADDLVPDDHPIGTKRICTDSGYYETFNCEHVRLVNLRREPLRAVTPTGVRTAAGDYELDSLVLATGFDAMTGALRRIDLRGPRGDQLSEAWADGPVSYLGVAVPGLPNLFYLTGPGSPSVLVNMVAAAEQQADWLVELMRHCLDEGVDEVEARSDAAQRWTRHVDEVAEQTLFPRAASWYTGANMPGKQRRFMPYLGGFGGYRRMCEQVSAEGYPGFVLTSRGVR